MLKEVNWSEDRSYRTGSESEPVQFYMEGLCNSNKFDLLLGYFSSAAINVLSLGFASFLYNGGTVRIVVNNILSQEDKNAIKAGREGDVQNTPIDLSDIKQLKRTLDDYGKHFFDCLAWLIANDKIQIRIIRPKTGRGIAHYKSGAFSDGTDTVGFKASCNFTAFGLLENLEELDGFLSWENSRSSKMINRQNKDFENIFSGNSDIVDYLEENLIQTRPYFAGNIMLQPAYSHLMNTADARDNFPVATYTMKNTFFHGTSPVITPEQIAYIGEKVDGFMSLFV